MNLEVINLIILIFFTFLIHSEISEPGLKGLDKLVHVRKYSYKNKQKIKISMY